MDEREYPIGKHLAELRKRIILSVVGFIVMGFVAYIVSDHILWWLRRPIENILGQATHFVVLTPHEKFFAQMKVSLAGGLFFAAPWIFYQLWMFVAPGLYKQEKKSALSFAFAAGGFFLLGGAFGYYVVFPPMFEYFIGTLPPGVEGFFSVGLMYGFAVWMLLAFGISFETPVLVFVLAALGFVEIEDFKKARRYVIVAAFVLGAILTPSPDPLSQTLMAVPMILLYELGVWAASILLKKNASNTSAAHT
jgi:sec-independent protein translocase protein TatC